jgi:glycogen debranching enzyme
MNTPHMLQGQLELCAKLQGTKYDPYTGEEPGKVFHEYPGVIVNGKSTKYSASDTTALYIIGLYWYIQQLSRVDHRAANDKLKSHMQHIISATKYIISHIDSETGLFIEDPKIAHTDRFALRVTYWKDSIVASRPGGMPVFPVAFTLPHVQNLCALRKAAEMITSIHDKIDITAAIENMEAALTQHLVKNEKLIMGLDKNGIFNFTSSDVLHALAYLERGDISNNVLHNTVDAATCLETNIGYRVMCIDDVINSNYAISDKYHMTTIWPFENAVIHYGAYKFGFNHVASVSSRIETVIGGGAKLDCSKKIATMDNGFPEFFIDGGGEEGDHYWFKHGFTVNVEGEVYRAGGSHTQLWTVAADEYFCKHLGSIGI